MKKNSRLPAPLHDVQILLTLCTSLKCEQRVEYSNFLKQNIFVKLLPVAGMAHVCVYVGALKLKLSSLNHPFYCQTQHGVFFGLSLPLC